MSILNSLASIKEYFEHWHNTEYEQLHKKAGTLAKTGETADYPITNKAVTEKFENVDQRIDEFAQVAKMGNVDWTSSYDEVSGRGFKTIVTGDKQNGLMSWQDKVQLKGLGYWYSINGSDSRSGLNNAFGLYINPGLRLAFLRYYQQNFQPKILKDDYYKLINPNQTTKIIYHIRPFTTIWGNTNHPYLNIGITSAGEVQLSASREVPFQSGIEINGTILWTYRSIDIYNNILEG